MSFFFKAFHGNTWCLGWSLHGFIFHQVSRRVKRLRCWGMARTLWLKATLCTTEPMFFIVITIIIVAADHCQNRDNSRLVTCLNSSEATSVFFKKLFSSGKTSAHSCFAVSVGGTWEVQRCKIQTSMTADAYCVFKIWLRPSIGGLSRVDLKRRLFMRRVQKLVHEPRWSTSRFKFDAQIYTSQTQSSDQMNAFPEFTLTWRQFGAKGFGLTTSSLAK